MDELIISCLVVALGVILYLGVDEAGRQCKNTKCKSTTVCKLSERATDKVFDCMQRGPTEVPWSGEDVSARHASACVKAHERTCMREPGFVCGGEQPLPCTLAFTPEELAACPP